MAWHAIYDKATGALRSVGSVIDKSDEDLDAEGLARREFTERPDQPRADGMWPKWNPATLEPDWVPGPKLRLTKQGFWARFTDAEREAVFNAVDRVAQAQKSKATAMLEYFRQVDQIRLDDPVVVQAINTMESSGLIAAGRATVILDG